MANTIGELNVEIGAKLDKLERGLSRMEKSIEKAGKQSEKTASKSFNKIEKKTGLGPKVTQPGQTRTLHSNESFVAVAIIEFRRIQENENAPWKRNK